MVKPYQHRPDIEEKRAEKKSKKNPERYLQFPEKFPIVIRMAQHTEQRRNAMYEGLRNVMHSTRSLINQIEHYMETDQLDLEALGELWRELQVVDYSLISGVSQAWYEAKEAQELKESAQ
jgi:hypothetical protein